MAIQKQPSINFTKVHFRVSLPKATISLRNKQVSQSLEDINLLVSMGAAESQKTKRSMQTINGNKSIHKPKSID